MGRVASGELQIDQPAELAMHVVVPLLLSVLLLALVQKFGRQLVKRPQLCPQLADTVTAAADAKPKAA